MDKFLKPAEERKVGDFLGFEGGDGAIVATVKWEMAENLGKVIEVDSYDEESAEPVVSHTETLLLCQQLEESCLQFINGDSKTLPLVLVKQICLFRAYLQCDKLLHGTQTTLDSYFR